MIPCLLLTYNRLEFTKQALEALLNSDVHAAHIFIIDNNSTDGTQEWLRGQPWARNVIYNTENYGIAGAMNQFLEIVKHYKCEFAMKVDNDTIVPRHIMTRLYNHMNDVDIVQAKHPITKATHPNGWRGFTRKMKRKGSLLFNHFVGGSGIMFRTSVIERIPETEWLLYGWRQWQREHPEVRKGFAEDVEIKLLDTDETGAKYPEEFRDYYIETGRLQ